MSIDCEFLRDNLKKHRSQIVVILYKKKKPSQNNKPFNAKSDIQAYNCANSIL